MRLPNLLMDTGDASVLFINTRPSGRQAFTKLGVACYELPLLSFKKRVLTAMECTNQKHLLAGFYEVLVVVSVTAAHYALECLTTDERIALQALSRHTLTIIAVGKATASVLTQVGLVVHTPADSRLETNEGMLQMTQIQALQAGNRMLVWKGVGGRRLLADTLAQQGVIVDTIQWYERVAPSTLQTQMQTLKLRLCSVTIVLITSQMALQVWIAACKQASIDHHKLYYIALQDRLTLLAKQQRLSAQTIYELSEGAVSQAIQRIKFQIAYSNNPNAFNIL